MSYFNHGILGINARNLLYIKPFNPKIAIKLADDKIKTKQFLQARGVPVPKLIARIPDLDALEKFDWGILPSSFVLKPNSGYGGEGIIVIKDKRNDDYIKINGTSLPQYFLSDHIESILSGRYSINITYDTAFFEQRLIPHEFFDHFTNTGLPDIRIVVHNLIPVMAMIRVPTKESEGKANVHLGGVGIGVDIAKGETTYAVQYNKIITSISGFGSPKGYKVPFWDDILHISSKLQKITNLGYLACDLVIDKNMGPVLLEINARAGLMVQIANLAPLRKRLDRIKGIKVNNPEKGVRIGQDLFGQKIEKDIKNISGKEIIGYRENIEILLPQGGTKTVLARIRPDLEKTVFSDLLMDELRISGDIRQEGQESFKIKFTLAGKKIQTLVGLKDLSDKDYDVIIGRRDLKDYLVDPVKEYLPYKKRLVKIDYKSIDSRISDIDSKLRIVYFLRPKNLDEESEKFSKDNNYNPVFVYNDLDFDAEDLLDRLKYIEIDDSPLGQIFEKKITQVKNKILLLSSIGDPKKFTGSSMQLYPKPSLRYVRDAYQSMKSERVFEAGKDIDTMETKKIFDDILSEYSLDGWQIVIKDNMVVDVSVGKNGVIFLKKDAWFSKLKIEQLIKHEIETHVLTAANGAIQPYGILKYGMSGYLLTQEGLAMYNQTYFVEKKEIPRGRGLIATHLALDKSFSDTYKALIDLGIDKELAFRSTVKVKRGLTNTAEPGAFTKDSLYYIGFKKIKEYVDKGGDLKDLYIGKINIDDLDILKRIKGIKPPKFVPKFLL